MDTEPVTSDNFDEQRYLTANTDVAQAVADGFLPSGRWHFQVHGHKEDRVQAVAEPRAGRLHRWTAAATQRLARPAPSDELASLTTRVYDLEVANNQLRHMLELHRLGPPPPKHLQVRVVGSYNGDFIRSGTRSLVPEIERAMAVAGTSLGQSKRLLDFGCGCGRALFALSAHAPDVELYGSDIDPEAIDWLAAHHPDLASYAVCPLEPPTGYGDDTFDTVIGISVFTHLPEELQRRWLQELRRITQPGGCVVLTVHGEHHSRSVLEPEQLEELASSGFLYLDTGYGQSIALPDFYQTAFHTTDYIRQRWSEWFEVVDVLPPGPTTHQDIVVLRKPGC